MSIITPEGDQIPTFRDLVRFGRSSLELNPATVLRAGSRGVFPWPPSTPNILGWWSPHPRCVLIPSEVYQSRSMAKLRRSGKLWVRADTNFEAVIRGCAARTTTWITEPMIQVMLELHAQGHAHSIETYTTSQDGSPALVGGLYGLEVGRTFMGSSMFSMAPNASKLALLRLAEILGANGVPFIDCQLGSAHLCNMGARYLPRDVFEMVTLMFAGTARIYVPWTKLFEESV